MNESDSRDEQMRLKVFGQQHEAEQAAAELRVHGWPDARPVTYIHGWVVECNEYQYLRQTGRVR